MGDFIAIVGCAALVIFCALLVLRALIRFCYFVLSLIFYFIIWLFMPKLWRDMHDA